MSNRDDHETYCHTCQECFEGSICPNCADMDEDTADDRNRYIDEFEEPT